MVGCAGEVERVGERFIASSLAKAVSPLVISPLARGRRDWHACASSISVAFYLGLHFESEKRHPNFRKTRSPIVENPAWVKNGYLRTGSSVCARLFPVVVGRWFVRGRDGRVALSCDDAPPGSAEPQLRLDVPCAGQVEAQLGLRGPRDRFGRRR